jgi:hypothetical protein
MVRPLVHTSSRPRNDICSVSFQYFREHLSHFPNEVGARSIRNDPKSSRLREERCSNRRENDHGN